MEYTLLVIVDRRSVTLVERAISSEERLLDLQIEGRYVGELRLFPSDLPNVAVSPSSVAVWGGRRLYLSDTDGRELRWYDRPEPIHAAYPVGERWCLVCETSVVVLDREAITELAYYEHDEVLLNHWWCEDQLVVMDFNGRRLVFNPVTAVDNFLPQ